eukprot:2176672-Rhodomonas_salina.3
MGASERIHQVKVAEPPLGARCVSQDDLVSVAWSRASCCIANVTVITVSLDREGTWRAFDSKRSAQHQAHRQASRSSSTIIVSDHDHHQGSRSRSSSGIMLIRQVPHVLCEARPLTVAHRTTCGEHYHDDALGLNTKRDSMKPDTAQQSPG